MTRKEIVKRVTLRTGIPYVRAKDVVEETLNAIIDQIAEDRRLELRNFGVFEVQTRRERVARNPRTGERVVVPERKVVTFKPGKLMKKKVREN